MSIIVIDKKDLTQSVYRVEVNNQQVNVPFWYSMIGKYGDDFMVDYFNATAYVLLGDEDSALAIMQPKATGTLIVTTLEDGTTVTEDTRNWYQNWIDNNL